MDIEEAQEKLDEEYNRWSIDVETDGRATLRAISYEEDTVSGKYEGETVSEAVENALKPDIIEKVEDMGFLIDEWHWYKDQVVITGKEKYIITEGIEGWSFEGHRHEDDLKNKYFFKEEEE